MNLSQGNHKLRLKNVYERENPILNEPVSLTLHSALKKLNTKHSIAYRCFPQASTLTFFLTCPFGQLTKTSCKSNSFGLVLYSAIKTRGSQEPASFTW